jgi:hypothetical protein
MTDEQRLQMITEQLLIVRDNLFRGMSKSIQKLQARSINEVLELENFTQSPQRTWVGLTDEEIKAFDTWHDNREEEIGWVNPSEIVAYIEAKLKDKNEQIKNT